MTTKAWASSGRRPSVRPPGSRTPRPLGSWGAALERARESWDGLTGGPGREAVDMERCSCGTDGPASTHDPGCSGVISTGRYSELAAAAILATALGLWSDTAAAMGEPGPDD